MTDGKDLSSSTARQCPGVDRDTGSPKKFMVSNGVWCAPACIIHFLFSSDKCRLVLTQDFDVYIPKFS